MEGELGIVFIGLIYMMLLVLLVLFPMSIGFIIHCIKQGRKTGFKGRVLVGLIIWSVVCILTIIGMIIDLSYIVQVAHMFTLSLKDKSNSSSRPLSSMIEQLEMIKMWLIARK